MHIACLLKKMNPSPYCLRSSIRRRSRSATNAARRDTCAISSLCRVAQGALIADSAQQSLVNVSTA